MLSIWKSSVIVDLHNVLFCKLVVTLLLPGQCPPLRDPDNGMIFCSLGDDGVPTEGDICVYECDDGYIVSGNGDRECQSDNTWTGNDAVCKRGENYKMVAYYLWKFVTGFV